MADQNQKEQCMTHQERKDLVLLNKIWRGGTNEVWLGTWKDKAVAVKKMNPYALPTVSVVTGVSRYSLYKREVEVLQKIQHDHIVKMVAYSLDRPYMIVLEPFGRSLHDSLYKKPANLALQRWPNRIRIAVQVASALAYIHKSGYVRRDLKSTDILISDDAQEAKLCDFDLTVPADSPDFKNIGTMMWNAPELLEEKGCSQASDVFSFGLVMFELTTGRLPFSGRRSPHQLPHLLPTDVIGETALPSSIWKIWCDVMNKCWSFDPSTRPTALQVFDVLNSIHNFIYSSTKDGTVP